MSAQNPLRSGFPQNLASRSTYTWWDQYQETLLGKNYGWSPSATATDIRQLNKNCTTIFQKIPALNNTGLWSTQVPNFVHKSIVVGSVQSGKTRAMVGLAAKAFDAGFRIVVVIAGRTDNLRAQTARRFHAQLCQIGESLPTGGQTHPQGIGNHGIHKNVETLDYDKDFNKMGSMGGRFSRALVNGCNVLAVVKKNQTPLGGVANWLRTYFNSNFSPVPLLILDDECDEASTPGSARATIPGQITNLWRGRPSNSNVPVAYVGFTATPQANIFQQQRNPLYPSISSVLEYPAESLSSVSYVPKPSTPDHWYTGSDMFFHWLTQNHQPNFLQGLFVTSAEAEDEEGLSFSWTQSRLKDAIVAYFVSGAIRLLVTPAKLGVSPFDAPAHSMLVHTDGKKDDHDDIASQLLRITNGTIPLGIRNWLKQNGPEQRINSLAMKKWLSQKPHEWKYWYDDFKKSFSVLQGMYSGGLRSYSFPSWSDVKTELDSHVFGNVKVKIINSEHGEKFDFSKSTNSFGTRVLPDDEFTILIGGNVLSRGLTIDGLSISYYTRRPNQPVGDTTSQRQRWFGYRGKHIEFCRLFTTEQCFGELQREGDSDKEALVHLQHLSMNNITNFKDHYLKPFGATTRSTTKTGTSNSLKLNYTGLLPQARFIHFPQNSACNVAKSNEQTAFKIVDDLVKNGSPVRGAQKLLGYQKKNITALQAADYLDSLDYVGHNPGGSCPDYNRFTSLASHFGISIPLHKLPSRRPTTSRAVPSEQDLYMVAAYLRAWHYIHDAVVNHGKRNYACTIDPSSSAVVQWQPCPPPKFNIFVRLGKEQCNSPLFAPLGLTLPYRSVERNVLTQLATCNAGLWGGPLNERNEVMDGCTNYYTATTKYVRRQSANGLLMLFPLSGLASDPNIPAVKNLVLPTFAVSIPEGGPLLTATTAR